MMKRIVLVLVFLSVAVACSSGNTGDEWASLRGELVVQGISSDSYRCVIAELEAAGIAAQDLNTTADAATFAAGQTAHVAASGECFTDAEVGPLSTER